MSLLLHDTERESRQIVDKALFVRNLADFIGFGRSSANL